MRKFTRRERYASKEMTARALPVTIATINFICDDNLGYVIRAAVCFGVSEVCVIGSIPPVKELNRLSGTAMEYVKLQQFSRPEEFLAYIKETNQYLISAELTEEATSIWEYEFPRNSCIVVGNEVSGVPSVILAQSEVIYIPMLGAGYCLNTSQTANVFLYEVARQFSGPLV